MTSHRQISLHRFADLVLPRLEAESFPCMSYDLDSIEPTIEALVRLRDGRVVPGYNVPGLYAAVAYEEAHLQTCREVQPDLGSCADRELTNFKALTLIKLEGYLAETYAPYEIAGAVETFARLIPFLRAEESVALRDDWLELAERDFKPVKHSDAYILSILLPCLEATCGVDDGERLQAARRLSLRMREACVRDALGRTMDADLERLNAEEALVWHNGIGVMPQTYHEEDIPTEDADFGDLIAGVQALDPGFAEMLYAPAEVSFPGFDHAVRVESYGAAPLETLRIVATDRR